jgi:hypothetical protein
MNTHAEMTETQRTVAQEIERFLRTGDSDLRRSAWSGGFMERVKLAHEDIREALVREVRRLSAGLGHDPLPVSDTVALTRYKVEPMVRGLFPRAEQDQVIALLERSVIFVTDTNIESLLLDCGFDRSAWNIANLYLASLGAELLGEGARCIFGLSEATTCYVTPEYFSRDDPFEDFIVHEAAHILHNCKRDAAGLRRTRSKEWLLDIELRKRETFAYSCEAYARVIAHGKKPFERRALAEQYARTARIPDDGVDTAEVAGIVQEAANARNGWKLILSRCAPNR